MLSGTYCPLTYNENSPFAPARHLNHGHSYSFKEIVLVTVGSVFLFPVRVVLLFLTTITYWFLVRLFSVGYWSILHTQTLEDPLPICRRRILDVVNKVMSRLFLGCYGIWMTRLGNPCLEVPTICNHVAFLDLFILMSHGIRTFVVMSDVLSFPFIGFIFRSNCCIFVDRLDKSDCQRAAHLLTERLETLSSNQNDCRIPVTSVFPEGTITNSFQLIKLKTGVFRPLVRLHPVGLRFIGKRYLPSNIERTFPRHLFRTLSQFVNRVEIDFSHSIVSPLSNEDFYSYTRRCESILASIIKRPVSSAVCEDIVEWTLVYEGKMNKQEAVDNYHSRRKNKGDFLSINDVLNSQSNIDVVIDSEAPEIAAGVSS
ncbi:hypothetical protein P9112_007761 [Eukaryota sp. TZLM1-RC]